MVKRLFLILILTFIPGMLPYAAAPSSNVYEIEVIVFENRLPDLEGGEFWTRKEEKNTGMEMSDAVSVGEKPAADSGLSATAAALESSGRHHVLAHLRWQQSAEAKSVSKPVKITSTDGALDGALRFYLSRFLLVDLSLTLREGAMSAGMPGSAGPEATAYRLIEGRRVKLAETHYFDHPKFGALVRVSPIKAN